MAYTNNYPEAEITKVNGGQIDSSKYDETIENLKNTAEEAHSNTEYLHDQSVILDIPNQITQINEKDTHFQDNDILLLEDSDDNYNKKKVRLGKILRDNDYLVDKRAIHTNKTNEINNLGEVTTLSSDDVLLFEDSQDGYMKKKVKVQNLRGSSDIQIDVSQMDPDSTLTGTSGGTLFGNIHTIDFDPDNDGAVYFNCRADRFWNVNQNINLQLSYLLDGSSASTNVKIRIDVREIDDGEAGESSIIYNQTILIPDNSSGHLEIENLTSFNINDVNSILVFKITRLASDAEDTYTGTFKLIKAVIQQ